jgi:hypothetical protein
MKRLTILSGLCCVVLGIGPATASEREFRVAAAPQATAPQATESNTDSGEEKKLTPEEKMNRRFPQPVRVGFLIGLPVLDWQDRTIGFITGVVRTPAGRIQLVVAYRSWLGWLPSGGVFDWGRRPVAVPLETVAILARQVAALDMPREEFDAAPTFAVAQAAPLGAADTIRIAVTRR